MLVFYCKLLFIQSIFHQIISPNTSEGQFTEVLIQIYVYWLFYGGASTSSWGHVVYSVIFVHPMHIFQVLAVTQVSILFRAQ